jgi:DNA-binding MarR family transcriptional regulator
MTAAPPLSTAADADASLAEALDRLARLVHHHRREIVGRHGLTPPLARALRRLDDDRPRAMGDLADVLRCDPSNVTGIVDRLEAKGLVERHTAEHDRRAKTVGVTAAGRRLLRRIGAELATLPPQLAALDERDRRALADVLGTVLGSED